MRRKLQQLCDTYKILLLLILAVGFCWLWLPFIEAARLTDPPLLGQLIAVLVYVVLSGLCITMFWQCVRGLRRYYLKHRNHPFRVLAVVFFTWSAVELFIAWFVAVIWVGNGSSVDTVLPFASLTPFLMFTPLGLLTRFLGLHGLSAAVIALITALALKETRRYAPALAGVLCIGIILSWGLYRAPDGGAFSAIITAEQLDDRVAPVHADTDVVVFPEYGLDDIKAATISERLVAEGGSEVFFVGSQQQTAEGINNVLLFGSTEQGFIEATAKSRLIPGGEYLPYAAEVPLKAFRAHQALNDFMFTKAIAQGTEPVRPFVVRDGLVLGAEACASIIAPNDYRLLTRQGATALVNVASLETFRSPVFDVQHEGLARFMAVANARPLLQSANDGAGFAIDHNGRMRQHIHPIEKARVTLESNQKKTPYTLLGEWPAYLGLGLLASALARLLYLRFKRADT